MAAGLQELPEFRNGLLRGDESEMRPVFGGDTIGTGLAAVEAAEAAVLLAGRMNEAGDEDDDVVFIFQIAGVDGSRVDDVHGKMVLFHNISNPARGHRAAVDIAKCDPGLMDLLYVRGFMA